MLGGREELYFPLLNYYYVAQCYIIECYSMYTVCHAAGEETTKRVTGQTRGRSDVR